MLVILSRILIDLTRKFKISGNFWKFLVNLTRILDRSFFTRIQSNIFFRVWFCKLTFQNKLKNLH